MLQNTYESLKKEFNSPAEEYSMLPFWFWNGSLHKDELVRQIDDFKSKGIDGFVIHPRIGLSKDIPYLGKRYMDFIGFAVNEAKNRNMKVVLYDEGMYPSGSAHGKVVEGNPEYAARALRIEIELCAGQLSREISKQMNETLVVAAAVKIDKNKSILPETIIELDVKDGRVEFTTPKNGTWQVIYLWSGFSHGTIRGIHFGEDDGENPPLAADLLNAAAVRKFIHLTHDVYYEALAKEFGKTVIAMFTDEPSLLGRCVDSEKMKPWTFDFLDDWAELGKRPLDLLALWFDIGIETMNIRRTFQQAIYRRLGNTYYLQLARWCEQHHIALTGHPEGADDIGYLQYFHIPGQDVVWRWVAPEDEKGIVGVQSTMAKCASDAARHLGRRRNSNECFGCCGPVDKPWSLTFGDIKWYVDWLFVRGANLLYPHAFMYSIDGEKRTNERPPDVGPNNLWWKYYDRFALYVKRMSWLMTDSINHARIAVLCGSEHLSWEIVKPLYENQLEFNYLEDRLLLSEAKIQGQTISIQQQNYDILLIEDVNLIDAALSNRLNAFAHDGGKILLYNPTQRSHPLIAVPEITEYEQILGWLKNLQVEDILLKKANKDIRITHVSKGECEFYLLVNEGESAYHGEANIKQQGRIEMWNAWNGKVLEVVGRRGNGKVWLPVTLERRESLIICVHSGKMVCKQSRPILKKVEVDLNLEWEISLPGKEKTIKKQLFSWTDFPGLEHWSGEIEYTSTVNAQLETSTKQIYLNLGDVKEMAELYIDGKFVDIKLWAPYSFDITDFWQNDGFDITVKVTNSISNKIAGTADPSGLLGPVSLVSYNVEDEEKCN